MDSGHWSGIAMVITALLLPFVTKASAGGASAKAEQAEAEKERDDALAEVKRERASGQRWFNLLVEWHAVAKAERHARLSDRQVMTMYPGAPRIAWEPLERFPDFADVVAASNAGLPPAE